MKAASISILVFALYAASNCAIAFTDSSASESGICSVYDPSESKELILSKDELNATFALMSIHHPWEKFFIAAPAAIALLGQLTVLGGQKDFRINDRPPKGDFKLIRNPESFRATMAQVSHDGWNSFSVAHRNMDMIQLNMLAIPRRVQTVVKIMQKFSPAMIQRMLPISLNGIKEISQLCVTLSRDTEGEFRKVMALLQEVVEATQSSRGLYDEKEQQSIAEYNASLVQRDHFEKKQQAYRLNQAEINRKVNEYEQRYKHALDSIPTGWTKVKMEITKAVVGAVASVIRAVPSMLGDVTSVLRPRGVVNSADAAAHGAQTGTAKKSDVETALERSTLGQQAYLLIGILDKLAADLTGNDTNFNDLASQLNVIGRLMPHLTVDPAFTVFSSLFNRVKNIIQRLVDLTSGLQREQFEAAKQSIASEVNNIKSQVEPLINARNPKTGPAAPSVDGQISGADELAQANSYQQWMRYHQQRADQNFQDLMKNHDMLAEVMVKMARLNVDRIEFAEILAIIRESVVILGQIQTHWSKLTEFFAAMAVRTEFAANQTINPFLQNVHGLLQESNTTMEDRDLVMQLILQPLVRDIQMAAHFIHAVSKTYVQVSSAYIMDQLAGMAGLSVLPAGQRQSKIQELLTKSKDAEQAIFQMAREKRLAYTNQVALLAQGQC
ncbi:uncharacterized protein LOC129596625 [Paramacrobiotus metropolitanus]|uniref:uncharacterized protein LOC129596625 n=1 Tax=Paramacrobiotus metropolitanus TaxID=2943436 RepID=UPI0024460A8D|nr:uncharacterized protein LOC129596625 [Paramacrobiotus metropolitanus]